MGKLKKRSIKSINIGFSCSEEWAEMKGSDQKRHCDSCNKSVIDFSIMSDQEIIDYLAKRKKQNTCGRFTNKQLTQLNHNLTLSEPNQLRSFAKTVAVGAMLTASSCSTTKDVSQNESCETLVSRYEIVNHDLRDTVSSIFIKGIVVNHNGTPLIGATVAFNSLKMGIVCDLDGKFSFRSNYGQLDSLELSVSYVGYSDMYIKVDSINKKEIKVVLEEGILLGDVIIERLKDPWYKRFVNGIIRPLR